MAGHWLVYIFTFVSTSLLVLSGYNYFATERKTQQQINRRLSILETSTDRRAVMAQLRRERGILGNVGLPGAEGVQEWLAQTGLRLDGPTVFLWAALLSVTVTAVTAVLLKFHPGSLPLGLIISAGVIFLILQFIRARRIDAFQKQMPDVLDIFVRGLRAGHPVSTAFSLVAKETADPAGTEFGVAFDEISFGLDVPTAMRNLARRVGDPDLLYLVTSISIQSQSGGNLAEILTRLSYMLRERSKLRLKVQAMTSEGRMTAVFLTLLPIALPVFITAINPKYYGDVWDTPAFKTILYVCAVLLVIGNIMMRRMVNFKY